MTEKNPFDMSHKAFTEYLDNFITEKRIKPDLEIAKKEKNVPSVRLKDNTQVKATGISPQKWSETDIAKDFYEEYSNRPKKDTIKQAHGGYVKKYANGGSVRKVRR
jgi:hypothetical protein